EIAVELLGRVGHGTEHAETAGIGDRGDHVTAVRESEDREVDSEQRGDSGLHRISPFGLSLMAGSLSRSPSPRVSSCLPVNGIAHRVRGTHGGGCDGKSTSSDQTRSAEASIAICVSRRCITKEGLTTCASAAAGTERPAMLSCAPGSPLEALVRQLLLRRDPLSDEDLEK